MIEPVRGLHQRKAPYRQRRSAAMRTPSDAVQKMRSPGAIPPPRRRPPKPAARAFLPSSTSTDEAKPFASNRLDQGLVGTSVADRMPDRVERRLVSVDSETIRPSQTASSRSSLLTTRSRLSDQVDEQIEDLRSDIDQLGAAPQLAAIHVYRIFTELKWHSGLRRRRLVPGRPRRRKSKAISGVNQVRVKALSAGLRHRRRRSA